MSQQLLRNRLAATFAIASLSVAVPAKADTLHSSAPSDGVNSEQVPQLEIFLRDSVVSVASPEDQNIAIEALSETQGVEIQGVETEQNTGFIPTKVGALQSPSIGLDRAAIATLYAHEMDGQPAATVYVRNLPIFTFLGTSESPTAPLAQSDAIIASGDGLDSVDPIVRATVLTSQLNQHHLDGLAADDIIVRWNADTEEIFVEAGDDLLLSVDKTAILPDSTGDVAEDALQATNRLRRQFGGAEELASISGLPVQPVRVARSTFSGMASWYGPGFHGRTSASGERFNQNAMTAAHRTLPFGTIVEVTNLNTGVSTIVRINDRGPYSHGRVIDLSAAAARAIGMMNSGVAPVSVDVLE
ncbi:MAG: septal ring lytic transglycosylase RlpA family protein [Merismopedia sp. SIO2A8]|nr:septal ring lytic transglycosylase RlpA family protein [Merismopedia sp. SIO2A8]